MKKILLLSAVVIVIASCAKKPENIAPVNIGSDVYANHSCSRLASEKLKISQDLERLSAKQNNAHNSDAMGVFLLGLPWSSMSGNDQEATIAIAKGRIQAIDRTKLRKRCR